MRKKIRDVFRSPRAKPDLWDLLRSYGKAMTALEESERFFDLHERLTEAFADLERWQEIRDQFREDTYHWRMAQRKVERCVTRVQKYSRALARLPT